MEESWRPVKDWEGLYEVSSLGRVRSVRADIILKLAPGRNGYPCVYFCGNGKRKCASVHRLVATAFVPNPHQKPFVNHMDETKTNNAAYNLDWVTHKENCNWGTAVARREAKIDHKAINSKTDQTNRIKACSKPVGLFEDGKLVKVWSSGAECFRETGIPRSTISHTTTGRTRHPISGLDLRFLDKERVS